MKNILGEKPTDPLYGRLKYTFDFVSDIKGKKILNIGCGFGWFEYNAIKMGAEQCVGIDLTEKDIMTAKNSLSDPSIKIMKGSAIDLPFKDNEFDIVVSWAVIEHIPKGTEHKMFEEIHRVLKDDGHFFMSTPYDSLMSKVLDPAYWLSGHRHYSVKRLKGYGVGNGFKVVESTVRGGMYSAVGLLNIYFCKWVFGRRPFFRKFFEKKSTVEYYKKGFLSVFMHYEKI